MSDCPCDKPRETGIHSMPAGLASLPRQLSTFSRVRRDLLAEVTDKTGLGKWRARDQQDLGLMWLEMWAYVADILGFYDERLANEAYLRTAVRRPSLRRVVDLLGYSPASGVGGSVTLAAIAEGTDEVVIPPGTGFRSAAFGDASPQVFETDISYAIHPLCNSWEIGARQTPGSIRRSKEFVFDTNEFGLAPERFILFSLLSLKRSFVSRVKKVNPFAGRDGKTYVRVELYKEIPIPAGISAKILRV